MGRRLRPYELRPKIITMSEFCSLATEHGWEVKRAPDEENSSGEFGKGSTKLTIWPSPTGRVSFVDVYDTVKQTLTVLSVPDIRYKALSVLTGAAYVPMRPEEMSTPRTKFKRKKAQETETN